MAKANAKAKAEEKKVGAVAGADQVEETKVEEVKAEDTKVETTTEEKVEETKEDKKGKEKVAEIKFDRPAYTGAFQKVRTESGAFVVLDASLNRISPEMEEKDADKMVLRFNRK